MPGQALQYNFTLESGTRLAALFHVEGGINDKVQVLLLDSANYELYKAHRPFAKTPSDSAISRVLVNTTSDQARWHLLPASGQRPRMADAAQSHAPR